MAVFEELQQMIAEKLSIEPSDIKPESHFIDDLGADSLDLADLVMVIEDKYEVDFSNEDTDEFRLVGDVVKAIEKLKG
ncbi:acyl carrier protein [bacterium]|nr:acyl carrier protein [bacterium]